MKGKKVVIVSLCGVLISTPAFAGTMSVIPELQEGESVIKKDLPQPTLVEHYHYSLLVPAGWSFEASVLTEGPYQGNLSAYPSNDVVNEKTHIGVFGPRRNPSKKSLDERYAKLKKLKEGEKLDFVSWQGRRWLIWEYSRTWSGGIVLAGTEAESYCWAAFGEAYGQEFVMIAATPKSSLERYRGQLTAIMQSVRLHPEMIDTLVAGIPDADKGFRLLFSAAPFPGYTVELVWRREEYGGNWYYSPQFEMEGWLCPALFKYFDRTPERIYAQVKAKTG